MQKNPYAILYNRDINVRGGDAADSIAAQGNLNTLEPIRLALSKLGHVELIEIGDGDPEILAQDVKRIQPGVVFNLAEAARGVAELEACVAGVLDMLGVAYTGSQTQTLALCLDKPKTKLILRGAGIPVPEGIVARNAEKDCFAGLEYPVIVKPACMDASHGIEPSNVAFDEKAARAKAAELLARFPPVVVIERFIDGREFNVAVVEFEPGQPLVLPFAEVDWKLPPGVPRVCGYEAKWMEGTENFTRTPIVCPARLSPEVERRVTEAALHSYKVTGCRDYATVDVRLDARERPFVLEVNPNPCLSPVAGVAQAAEAAGWSYEDLIRRVAGNAGKRGPLAPLADHTREPRLAIRPAGVKGRGVFTLEPIAAGRRVIVFGGRMLSSAELTDDLLAMQVGPDLWLCSDGSLLDDCINHSCHPNTGFLHGDPVLYAMRDIAAGEEICWDYSTSISETGWSMPCHCGAPTCRGVAQAWGELSAADRQRLRGWALAYLRPLT
jgi:D-alanine-D-alanine ligase